MHKGKCLEEFFNRVKWQPRKIVFVDDQMKSLEEVKERFIQSDIEYLGIHYCFLKDKITDINCKIYDVQLEYLNRANKLLSDQEAQEILDYNLV